MRRRACTLGICVVISLVGCGQQDPPRSSAINDSTAQLPSGVKHSGSYASGSVAIVDLDEVARRLGHFDQIRQDINARQNSLNRQLPDLQSSLRRQYDQKKNQLGPNPTQVQLEELKQLHLELGKQLRLTQRRAQKELDTYRNQRIRQFQDQVKPVAQAIAKQRGMLIVMPKNDTLLLTFDPAADITDQVVEAMKAKTSGSPGPLAPAPRVSQNPNFPAAKPAGRTAAAPRPSPRGTRRQ